MTWSAGCRSFDVPDDGLGLSVTVYVMYPSASPEHPETLGPFRQNLALDAPVAAGVFPLVVLSHGNGGSGIIHRTTGADLARAGYIVALLEHPGNNRNDNTIARTLTNLERRPRHVSLILDWAFGASPFAASLVPGEAAVIGHSLGAYTALAVAGGVPTSSERETSNGQTRRVDVTPDERVKALVLLAPATPWFMAPDALRAVNVPILLLDGEKDEITPAWHAEIVVRGVADASLVDHRTIANAGHFSFQSPFPESMKRPGLAPAHDPDGFDRARFNDEMNADIREFLDRVLAGRP